MNSRSQSTFNKIEEQIAENFCYLPRILGYSVIETTNVTMIKCGFKTLSFNIVCRTRLEGGQYEVLFDKVKKNYGKIPCSWVLGNSNFSEDFGEFLKSKGLIKIAKEQAMIYDLTIPYNVKPVDTLNIQLVTTLKQLQDYSQILKSFEPDIDSYYVDKRIIESSIIQKNNLFIGYMGDVPVSTGSLFFNNDLASLHDLVTVEKYRGKGIGSNMVKYRMDKAKEMNFSKICVSSSSTIFKKMGFEHVGEFDCYVNFGEN